MATYVLHDGRTLRKFILANIHGWRVTYKVFDNGPSHDTVIVSRTYRQDAGGRHRDDAARVPGALRGDAAAGVRGN